ncbi:MAG: acetyl-CoA C-acetyltransferase [Saprospiraceae bacterium]|jgi:acetyl-CoA C-acetyltransferase
MTTAYIVSAVRTPLGSFGGGLKGFTAVQLGSLAIKGALGQLNPELLVDEVFMGNVVSANLGQAPARQASITAGIANTVPCTTVNKVCASGMKAIMFAAQSVMLGQQEVVVAGGMESMSNIPFYLPNMRWGHKFGQGQVIDGLQKDGLVDAYDHKAMGMSGDATAAKYSITREQQDEYAINSYKRSAAATEGGKFKNEIIPITIPQRRRDDIIMSEDEEYKNVRFDKIPNLRAAFNKDGTVTAANASTLNDGASALIVVSEEALKKHELTPLARIVSFADAAHEPEWFTTAPTLAAPLAIKRAGLNKSDIDYYEVNEAFSVVAMAFAKECEVSYNQMNVNGGAVSLGHPLGCSGARIVTTLLHTLDDKAAKYGLATLCNGGGGASAMIIENLS